ncbi:DUF6502 family protein [Piscinibacter terrae]|uniref:Uncharacterized protein n=1 Tax=Piscinibacter terrae TaxID=2496871 RepID=A0A3N7HRE1_9BURK|nr:DUF6502 family protein [Albitalea terrae]RQP23361.1 hypothetical protein DZC73_19910 [Albitalea terrae]
MAAIPPSLAEPVVDSVAVLDALRQVISPLAMLAVARGVSYGEVEELVKAAFTDAAVDVKRQSAGEPPSVSHVSAATGLSRREVSRLMSLVQAAPTRKSHASEIFVRWLTDPRFGDKSGPRRRLARTGQHPSFQSLAESVSKDVKPRTHLDELCRLGLARLDEASDVVELLRDTFVPSTDERQMFGFLGDNVGDHLRAAAENVLRRPGEHLEQALFADELSAHSLRAVRPLVDQQWQSLVRALVPVLNELIEADRKAGRPQNGRIRIGLYAYSESTTAAVESAANP